MVCCFSGREVPTSKLLILYYPPAAAHDSWDRSVYAAARGKEALAALVSELKGFHRRYVVSHKLVRAILLGVLGAVGAGLWCYVLLNSWDEVGFLARYLLPAASVLILLASYAAWHGFFGRKRLWRKKAGQAVEEELREIQEAIEKLPDDPSAEEAAGVLRRSCPEVLSEIAFEGSFFRAFTYMDFVMFPMLKHPSAREELPDKHSLNRDAYYVGSAVYDSWRMFQKDLQDYSDPRFAGSAGRRGVI